MYVYILGHTKKWEVSFEMEELVKMRWFECEACCKKDEKMKAWLKKEVAAHPELYKRLTKKQIRERDKQIDLAFEKGEAVPMTEEQHKKDLGLSCFCCGKTFRKGDKKKRFKTNYPNEPVVFITILED